MTIEEFLNSESDLMPVRQMSYGPVMNEYHHAAMYGPAGNALSSSDVAASPDTGLQQGDLIMAQDGTLHTVADWSYLHPGQPTHQTIEFRDRKDSGRGFIKKVGSIEDFLGVPSAQPGVSVGTVTDQGGDVVGLPAQQVQQPESNLPPEEQGLQNILGKHLAAGAQAGVYPKAEAATQDDHIAQAQEEEPSTQKSFQEKTLDFLEGKGSFTDLITPAVTGIRRAANLPTTGSISEQDIAESVGGGGEAPLVFGKVPTEERQAQDPGQFVSKTGWNILSGVVNFANTPTGAATIMTGGMLPATAQSLVALGFGAQAVKGALDHAIQGDLQGAAENLGIGVLAAHGAKEAGKAAEAKPIVPPEGFEVLPEQQGPRGFQMQQETTPEQLAAARAVPQPPPPVPEQVTPVTQRFQQPSGPAVEPAAQPSLPTWTREEMIRRGLDPNRPLNDVDIQNPSVIAAVNQDPTLSVEQKASVLKTGSPRPEPQIPEPAQFSVDMPTDSFGTEHTPISSFLIDNLGGVVSKSAARRSKRLSGNEALWDDAPSLGHPTHNKVYNPTGEMPDAAAQALYDAGLIHEPSVTAMWQAIQGESTSARTRLKAERTQAIQAKGEGKQKTEQTQQFIEAQQQGWKGEAAPIPVNDLQVGDKVTVAGEHFKVTDIDPDNYDVTIEDGRKFGVQTVKDNTVIYGEHEPLNVKPPKVSTIPDETIQQAPDIRPVPTGLPPWELAQAEPERALEESGVATRNAYTEGRRPILGMEPAEETIRRRDAEVREAADAVLQADPAAGQKLVGELSNRVRLISDVENNVLARHIADLEAQHAQLVDHINATQDPASQERLNEVRDNLQTAFDASIKTGAELGRGLRQRQVEEEARYTLARMEAERRAVNGGEPLPPVKLKETEAVSKQIRETSTKLAERERALIDGTARMDLPKTQGGIVNFLDKAAEQARKRIIARRGRLNIGIDPTAFADEIIIGASHIARGARDFGDWSRRMLRDFGDRVNPYLDELYNHALALHDQVSSVAREKSLKAFKTRTANTIEELKQKVATGDVAPPIQRSKLLLDPEAQRLRDELGKAKYQYQVMLEKDRLAKRPMLRKIIDKAVDLERAIKLTGITTFGKLGGAGLQRVGQTIAEEMVGTALSFAPVLRRVMQEAPTEGTPTLRAAVQYGKGFAQGIRDIPDVIRGRKEVRDVYEGTRRVKVPSVLDYPGRVHGAEKQPFKSAQEAMALSKALAVEMRKGTLDKRGAIDTAYERAVESGRRSIFTNDNVLSNGWNNFMNWLEYNKKFPTGGYVAAKIGRFLMPIVRVPTNIAIEVGIMSTGTLSGSFKLMQVMKRGMRTIKPEEADFIARHLKKGAVGAGLFMLGYMNPKHFGGFYQEPGKKKDRMDRAGLGYGEARIYGVVVPKWFLHSPAALMMQLGATTRKLMDVGKSGPVAAMTGAREIIHDVPFINEMVRFDNVLKDNWEGERARGTLARGSVVPVGVQNIADWLDDKKRAPKTPFQYIETGIPGLRQNVPLAKHQ